MENFIGMVLATLEEAGIDTSNLTVEEAIEKYNELVNQVEEFEEQEEITVEDVAEQVEEPIEKIVDEPIEEVAEEVAEEEPAEEPAEGEKQEPVEITEEEYADLVVKHKDEIIAFLKEKELI